MLCNQSKKDYNISIIPINNNAIKILNEVSVILTLQKLKININTQKGF
jgi:hypothetical protein